jgi:hypothetical protein
MSKQTTSDGGHLLPDDCSDQNAENDQVEARRE